MRKRIIGLVLAATLVGGVVAPTAAVAQEPPVLTEVTLSCSGEDFGFSATFTVPEPQVPQLQDAVDRLNESQDQITCTLE